MLDVRIDQFNTRSNIKLIQNVVDDPGQCHGADWILVDVGEMILCTGTGFYWCTSVFRGQRYI